MWRKISYYILRYRAGILITLGLLTSLMLYNGTKVELSYEFARLLPSDDPALVNYEIFKKQFGQDGAVMVVGIQDDRIYKLDNFNAWYRLGNRIKSIDGIEEVISLARLYNLNRNDSLNKFDFKPVITEELETQQEVDSVKEVLESLSFYEGFIFNKETRATLMAITFDKQKLNSRNRLDIVDNIVAEVNRFSEQQNIETHISGLPYIRSIIAKKVSQESIMFMVLAFLVTILILFVFLRSLVPVAISLIVVIAGAVWSFGLIELLTFKLTILSGLIAPLIIVIGVPNCIMLINKYQTEFLKHGNKMLALARMIEKVGIACFLANFTTAIGFGVFCFTNSAILVEFGLVASISVMTTYVLSMLIIPTAFSYLPVPKAKDTKHLSGKAVTGLLIKIDRWVHHYRPRIYIIVGVVFILSIIGLTKIKALGYVVDDLPENDPIYVDLKFFEKNFYGILPFEIAIDARKPGEATSLPSLYKINKLQKLIAEYPEFSKPLSIVEAIKFSNQAYHYGKKKFYILPGALDLGKISQFSGEASDRKGQFKAFIDTTRQKTRVSVQMADVGSVKMKKLLKEFTPRMDSIFNYDAQENKWLPENEKYKLEITGNSIMFLKGNDYLVKNLVESVGIALVLITIVMLMLFMSFRMVVISVIPSLFPLIITAGLMGYFNIALKPSTILIFSIAFGISSDGTLYFLTKYKQEFMNHDWNISRTVSATIRETGVSMVYTAIILFSGFAIFTASSFGGTAALGILISITLLIAYCSNLVLLPALLLSLEKIINKKALMQEPLIQLNDEEGDIEIDDLVVRKNIDPDNNSKEN